ncbi:MAG: hypothetical protein NVS2B8_04020 [Vulcanimicrobiaceae bacterium]
MAADRTHLRVGETLRLTIAARVDERVLELDNVTLPDLAGFDTLGDERRCSASARGTDCTETLTLQPTVAGDRTLAAAVMDAVDGRNGQPSRFATNTVALRVAGEAPHLPSWLGALAWSIVLAILPLVLVVVAAWALIWGFGRRKPVAVAVAAAPPSATVAIDPDVRLRELVADLAREPSRVRARAVRAALRARVGARDDETLADIVARRQMADRDRVLAALRAIERASFCEEHDVPRAVEEALPSLNF